MTQTAAYAELAEQARIAAERVAALARELADMETHRENVLRSFHRHSAARKAAEVLFDREGQWVTRRAIAEESGCQPNAVAPIIKRLHGREGIIVERRVTGGEAEYRLSVYEADPR